MAEMNENREEEKAEGAAAADQTPGHESTLTRDPDDASNALARVQQIFERLEDLPENKHQKKESGEDEEKSEAAPVTPEAAEELREICEKLLPSDIAWVLEALRKPLPVPVVWNSGGYERVETLRTLEGKVQIYLPDLKYAMERPARELSAAPDYFEVAAAAIDEMVRQVGAYQIGDDGLMRSGVILRHLVLPGQMENTKRVIDYVSTHFPPKTVLFSLMSQYTPQPGSTGALARRLNEREYRTAVQYMRDCGLTDGFCQELSSAKEEYTPVFDLQGV